jgi:hypothetical protein
MGPELPAKASGHPERVAAIEMARGIVSPQAIPAGDPIAVPIQHAIRFAAIRAAQQPEFPAQRRRHRDRLDPGRQLPELPRPSQHGRIEPRQEVEGRARAAGAARKAHL